MTDLPTDPPQCIYYQTDTSIELLHLNVLQSVKNTAKHQATAEIPDIHSRAAEVNVQMYLSQQIMLRQMEKKNEKKSMMTMTQNVFALSL